MPDERRLKIVLADDQQLFREGVQLIIQPSPDLEIVGEVDDGNEVLKAVDRWKPDVLILDLLLSGRHGLELVREVTRKHEQTRVLVLTAFEDEPFVREAMFNGADGYLLKRCGSEELLRAIRTVAVGRVYVCEPVAAIAGRVRREENRDIYDTLTERERMVVKLIADGHSTPRIANELYISPRTAETHRCNLMRKLGCNSQTDIIRFAVRKGLVEV